MPDTPDTCGRKPYPEKSGDGNENVSKKEFALLQTLSRLFHFVYFVKCWQMLLELNFKVLYEISGKEQESCCRGLPSSAKRELRHFHVVVARRRQQNVHVQNARAKLLFYLSSLLLFCRSRCRRCRRCLSALISGYLWKRRWYYPGPSCSLNPGLNST